ncbi:MAG TPA: SRPBCC family protein, partial [Acidimicrobiia bacterium]|nr:SRPBCC family protein [Acidimicrobiia bacterium]
FDYVADFSHGPEWQRGVRRARWTSEPPIRVGSTYEQEARFLGKRVVSSFQVIGYDAAARSVTITTTSGTFPITVTRTVEADGDGARYTEHVVGEPRGVLRALGPLMHAMVRGSVRRDQDRLRDRLRGGV